MIGIYRLTCDKTGKSYIGQSKDIRRRMWEHKCPNSMKYSELKKDILRYGFDSFKQEVLEECSLEELNEKERFYIAKYKPEYNVSTGGYAREGTHLSEEQKKHLSECGKRQWAAKTDSEKERIVKHQLIGPKVGHEVSETTRAKLRAANLGKKQSAETRAKRSQALKGKPRSNRHRFRRVRAIETGQEFESIKAAAIFVGATPSQVGSVLRGRRKTCRGYHWEYLQ